MINESPRNERPRADRRGRADRAGIYASSPKASAPGFRPSTTCCAVPIAERVFEPRVGGRVYDRGVGWQRVPLGTRPAYEPPTRVVISWDISPRWQIETDVAKTSEVEVRFIPEGPDPHAR